MKQFIKFLGYVAIAAILICILSSSLSAQNVYAIATFEQGDDGIAYLEDVYVFEDTLNSFYIATVEQYGNDCIVNSNVLVDGISELKVYVNEEEQELFIVPVNVSLMDNNLYELLFIKERDVWVKY